MARALTQDLEPFPLKILMVWGWHQETHIANVSLQWIVQPNVQHIMLFLHLLPLIVQYILHIELLDVLHQLHQPQASQEYLLGTKCLKSMGVSSP